MIRRPPRSTLSSSSAASDVYKRQGINAEYGEPKSTPHSVMAANTSPSLPTRALAEAIGTGIIVHGGCGVVCAAKYGASTIGPLGISLVWGGSVALAVYATRDVSGAHLNPAVTAALAVNKPDDFPRSEALPYITAQIAGATVAGAVNYAIWRRGIEALELTEKAPRGCPKRSPAIYHGAFGMVPNTALLRTPVTSGQHQGEGEGEGEGRWARWRRRSGRLGCSGSLCLGLRTRGTQCQTQRARC
eukprot:TRINITY_DN5060_c0_g1_i3.p1 TRINITY_DN5060_c0_g1~~TRINITY_DN5060_c0_g1_i3.p1  ORF type:complete len:245 (-),score=28.96 TRINITY_DN5060_c0_g1_i3:577-1311(-)